VLAQVFIETDGPSQKKRERRGIQRDLKRKIQNSSQPNLSREQGYGWEI